MILQYVAPLESFNVDSELLNFGSRNIDFNLSGLSAFLSKTYLFLGGFLAQFFVSF